MSQLQDWLVCRQIKYDDAQKALEQGGFNLSRPEMQQLVSQLVDEMDEQGDIQ